MMDSIDSGLSTGYMIGRDSGNGCNGNGMGWGMDGWWGLIIILALFGYGGFGNGWGNGGFGGNNGAANYIPYAVGNSYTDSAIQRGFDNQAVISKLDGINSGLCDGFYAMNTGMLNATNNLSSAICNLGYEQAQLNNATNVAIMQAQNAIQTQNSDCCCRTQTAIAGVQNAITGLGCSLGREIERGFCDVNYNMATNTNALMVQSANNTRDIIDSQNAGTRAILDYLCQDKISTLQAENQALRLSASQQAQNVAIGAMITASEANILRRTGSDCPIPAYVVPNPNCCYGPFGYNGYNGFNGYNNNSSCGCGCGCNN